MLFVRLLFAVCPSGSRQESRAKTVVLLWPIVYSRLLFTTNRFSLFPAPLLLATVQWQLSNNSNNVKHAKMKVTIEVLSGGLAERASLYQGPRFTGSPQRAIHDQIVDQLPDAFLSRRNLRVALLSKHDGLHAIDLGWRAWQAATVQVRMDVV